MRCPDCNKFVSFDSDVEPEIDVDVSGTEVVGSVRIVNNCGECGTELKEASFDISEEILDATDHATNCDGELSVEVDMAERTDRLENKTRSGKLIKHARYMKHLYGAQANLKVTCDKCEFEALISWSDEVQGSGMDELT